MKIDFPFSAVVGQDDLKLALLLAAVDPSIGGVLIRGERGTAKSTMARGLAALLPARADGSAAPFVELPLGATEDRVVGSLDVGHALREGRTQLRSGVLAQADGGVLYVDEVNLLADHLVDLLLDAAARGWVTVERDGVSAGEAARFVLIGTMNPEEGELRPQFLDRFGLSVQVRGPETREMRMAAVSRRLAFDENPSQVVTAARASEDALRESVLEARRRLHALRVTDGLLSVVTDLCADQRLDGIRGDLAIVKAARALAAWEAATEITPEHIRRASELALPHRLRRRARGNPQPAPGERPPPTTDSPAQVPANTELPRAAPDAPAAGASIAPPASSGVLNLVTDLIGRESSGRRATGSSASRPGSRAVPYDETGALAINETLTVAASRGVRAGAGGVSLSRSDLMQRERSGPGRCHILFLVDASASMAARRRIELAKGAALRLLDSNYQRRDEVALMVFRGESAELRAPFTNNIAAVEDAVSGTPTGGRTPLARALLEASVVLRERDPSLLVLFTDGRANVSHAGGDPWTESLAACETVRASCAGILVIDCEAGPILLGRAGQLARELQAECVPLRALETQDLAVRIHERIGSM